jgi:carbon dioxide concentrating mechanism protein CcmN
MIPLPVAMPPPNRTAVISGDVTVHPTANIGSGVLLHADPGSQLIIGVGACVGAGCVIHAHTGTLFIGDGVILGMGTLVFGTTQVGERACIGADSSLIDVSIAPNTVVPPNSLIDSYSLSAEYANAHPPDIVAAAEVAEKVNPPVVESIDSFTPKASSEPKTSESSASPPEPFAPPKVQEAPMTLTINAPIYGKAGLERLLATLRNQR